MVTMKDLLECGVHFGHQTRRWNPKMKKFIFGVRKNIYIIDLQKTLRYFRYTYNVVRDRAAEGQTMIFVGTKKQASETIKKAAQDCGMPYVNHRWLGGMLTNFGTIKKSIRKLEIIKKMREEGQLDLLTKKEALMLSRKEEKLELYLGGIKDMHKLPDMMFVLDAVKEKIAIAEARRLGITVVAPLDTNCDPDVVDLPIPGNDDAVRSIKVMLGVLTNAICEANELPLDDYVTEDDKKASTKEEVKETKTEEVKVDETVLEEIKEMEKADELEGKTLADLKKLAKEAGIKGYSTMKKDELIAKLSE